MLKLYTVTSAEALSLSHVVPLSPPIYLFVIQASLLFSSQRLYSKGPLLISRFYNIK